jgi:hypothetical protein
MRRLVRLGLLVAASAALVLGWGYWHAMSHASLYLHVDDHGLKSATLVYGAPHDVTLTLRDRSGVALAAARSIEPAGYILAVHPDPAIGTCEHRVSPSEHAACYEQYSAWSSRWAPDVHSADVKVGACELRGVPVRSSVSNGEWLLWWVPLPHVGGRPRRYFDLAIAVDSRACRIPPAAAA